jgi:hypothetical protein
MMEPEPLAPPPPPSLRRPLLWTFAILAVVYLPLFFGKIIFFRDIAHWGFPARAFLRESLLGGELPAWNPYQGLGFPVMGDPLYGIFYPPNWLFLLVGPGFVADMVNWQCFAHLFWGTAGVVWLARRLGAGSTGIVVAGLVWALSGYTTAQWTIGLQLLAIAWVPWAAAGQVALLDSLHRGGRAWLRGVVKAALPVAGGVLLGEVFITMIGAGFGVVFAAALAWLERGERPPRPAWLLRAGLAVLLAFAAGAIVIVPARLLLGTTERSRALPAELAEQCSLHPLRLVEFAVPQSMGDAYGDYPAAAVIGEPKLDGLPLSYSMYMGASALALALVALGRRRRLPMLLAALALAALVLALGKHTPVYGIFRRIVLPLSYMRYPEKYVVLFVTMLALLAGLGSERLLAATPQPWRRSLGVLGGIVAFAALAYAMLPEAWMVFAVHGAMLGSLAMVGLLATHLLVARRSRLGPILLVAVVTADLAATTWLLQGFGGRRIASAPPAAARLALRLRSSALAPPRIYRSNQTNQAVNRWVLANTNTEGEYRLVETLVTNTVNAWGIATLPGYDAAMPALLERVWTAGLDVGQSALRLLGAEFVVLPVSRPGLPLDDRPGLLPVLEPLPGARMYRVPGALPRVFLARHAEVLADEHALPRLFERDVVLGESVWLAPEHGARPLPAAPGRAGECRLDAYANRTLVATCVARERGVAVFVEQYDRGWRATVNGSPATLWRANLVMRALPLEAGTHRIALTYHTPGLALGAAISLLALVLLGGCWALGRCDR